MRFVTAAKPNRETDQSQHWSYIIATHEIRPGEWLASIFSAGNSGGSIHRFQHFGTSAEDAMNLAENEIRSAHGSATIVMSEV